MDLVLLAVTRPWTYWMAPVLVTIGLSAVVGLLYGYHRQVLGPYYRMLDHRAGQERSATIAAVTDLADVRRAPARPAPRRLVA